MKLMKGKLPFPDDGNCRLFRGRQKKTIFFSTRIGPAFIICLFFFSPRYYIHRRRRFAWLIPVRLI